MYTLYVGLDIAAESISCYWENPKVQKLEIPQTTAGYQRLAKALLKTTKPQNCLIALEATGNYWLGAALYLHEQGFQLAVLNPSHVHHFALAGKRRAKNDPMDAQLLADYAQSQQPPVWTPPPAIFYALQQRLSLREDLQNERVRHLNRLHALQKMPQAEASVLARLQRQIEHLAAEIKALEVEIRDLLLSEAHHWAKSAAILMSIPGIGLLNCAWILCLTHNFERCLSPEEAAAYAGLVPYDRDSGKKRGRRFTGGGHPQLRKMLYLAAGAALRFNPPLKLFYQRLVARGKIKQVARVAVARKLMHMAWACVVKQRFYDPNFGQQACAAQVPA